MKDVVPEEINQDKDNIAYPQLPITRPVKVIPNKAAANPLKLTT